MWDPAVLVGHDKAAEKLMERLAVSDFHTPGRTFIICIPRRLGAAAVMLGRLDEARAHWQAVRAFL